MDYVIIVAGGKGLRMGGDIPKQFLPIGGKPVLMRTLERFSEYSADLQIILVLPEAQQDYWKRLCEEYHFEVAYQLANGGQTRFHSVQNGLALVPDDAEGVVGVHDGVRPFPSIEVIRNCYETARTAKAVIPVIPVVETVRKLDRWNPSPFPVATIVLCRHHRHLTSNCSRMQTANPTTTALRMMPVSWSRMVTPSPSSRAIERISRSPHPTTSSSPRQSSILNCQVSVEYLRPRYKILARRRT